MMTVLPLAAPPASPLPAGQVAKLRQAAEAVEAMALGELLKPMFETVDSAHGLFGGGHAEAAWKPMLVEHIAKRMAASGGLGLAGPIFTQMLRVQEAALNGEMNR